MAVVGRNFRVNWAKKKSAAMNAETFEAYDVASWNPACDEPTEEEPCAYSSMNTVPIWN